MNVQIAFKMIDVVHHIFVIIHSCASVCSIVVINVYSRRMSFAGAFRVEIQFPPEFPFKPPRLMFLTKIYHPNVDPEGLVCLPIILPEKWKPATKVERVS